MVIDQERAVSVSPGVGAGGGAAARENRITVIPFLASLTSEGGEVHALQQSRIFRGNGRGSQIAEPETSLGWFRAVERGQERGADD